jgi:8-oxo-dGTP pyrophosphatase MutT (NUDIX family)
MPEIDANMVQVHPFRMRGGVTEHLVLLRSATVQYRPSIWQVITGRCQDSERSIATARRELLEETGLYAVRWYGLPAPALFYFEPADRIILSPLFACELEGDAEPVLSEEHVKYDWLSASQAHSRLMFPSHAQGVDQLEQLLSDPSRHRIYEIP